MPTLCSCPASTTAQATILVWHRQMFHSPRLIWQFTFFGCVHTSCRISTTCKKRVWLPWTCVLFKLLSKLSSACVLQRKPMRNPARKLLRRARQETSGPVLEPQSKFPRKSVSISPANYARNMWACIPCSLPRTVAGTRKTERWKLISTPTKRQVRNPIKQNVVCPAEKEIWQVGEDS